VTELREARRRVEDWPLAAAGRAELARGIARTYRRGRRALAEAYLAPTAANFHEWRKRAKYHWYHMRLLSERSGGWAKRRIKSLKQLSTLLGDNHDLDVLRQIILDEPDRFGTDGELQLLLRLSRRRQHQLQELARPLGRQIYRRRAKAAEKRIQLR